MPVPTSGTQTNGSTHRLPVYFIGHAGVGVLWNENSEPVRENMRQIGEDIRSLNPKPKAIISVSGHFQGVERTRVELNANLTNTILYDYNGDFRKTHPHVFEYTYEHDFSPAPELLDEIARDLKLAGIGSYRVDRGLDHGTWVPFKVAFPPEIKLDIPVVQVSTYRHEELDEHIKLGKGLKSLRSKGYLIVGNGMDVHSFPGIRSVQAAEPASRQAKEAEVLDWTKSFDNALRQTIAIPPSEEGSRTDEHVERDAAAIKVGDHPAFQLSHPTAEHLTPLYVAIGAAGGDAGRTVGSDFYTPGMAYTNWRFG